MKFIALWIAFNAAYAHEIEDRERFRERKVLLNFIGIMLDADVDRSIEEIVWSEFPKSIRLLLSNQYVFQPFWDYQAGKIEKDDWEAAFDRAKASANRALGRQDTVKVLAIVFDRLYTLRNQLIHGGATWHGSVNREQIRDAASFLSLTVPTILSVMIESKPHLAGQPCYPTIG